MATEFLQDLDQNSFHELDDHRILIKFFEDFDQNSGSQPIIQMTTEFFKNQITTEFFWDLIRIFQEMDDHGFLMKFFKDFYQNFGGRSKYPNSGILLKF